jgi:hypothetical protein
MMMLQNPQMMGVHMMQMQHPMMTHMQHPMMMTAAGMQGLQTLSPPNP